MRYVKEILCCTFLLQFCNFTGASHVISSEEATKMYVESKVRTALNLCHLDIPSTSGLTVPASANCTGSKYQLASINRADDSMGWHLLFASRKMSFHHDSERTVFVIADHNGLVLTSRER